MLRRFLCCTFAALCLYSINPCRISAVETAASAAILVDAASGRVLYERNADRKMLIASTTKILTALVAIEQGNLQDTVKVSREAACTEGSAMYLKEGETLTLETLLYGLLLCSGNDAAVAVAQHVGGSVKGFVALMNEKARELEMENSSFANPNGLDDENHYSTARDMAKLARAALENETLVRIASTRSITIGGRTMHNHNKLLGYMDNCLGLKTGYTKAAGRTLVSCAEKNGQRLIAVTLQDGNDWADHQALCRPGKGADPGICQRRHPFQRAADRRGELLLAGGSVGATDHGDLPGPSAFSPGCRRDGGGRGGVPPERSGSGAGTPGGGADGDAEAGLGPEQPEAGTA